MSDSPPPASPNGSQSSSSNANPSSTPPTSSSANTSTSTPPKEPLPPPRPQNPVFRALGLPNIRPRLPSRNWTIFLSVTGTITALVLYDKREARRNTAKWCSLVSHIASEPLPVNQMPRKIKVYVQAPPGDSLGPAREMFYDYIKPVLVAGALEWEVVEARREGDVRWAVAENIRKRRRKAGEVVGVVEEDAVDMARERAGTRDWAGVGGELVLGRHAWMEWARGVHEGWLGPVEQAEEKESLVEKVTDAVKEDIKVGAEMLDDVLHSADRETTEGSPAAQEVAAVEQTEEQKKEAEEEEKRKKLYKPPPYNSTLDYASAVLPRSIPDELEPVAVVPFPHLLGFLGTPTRVYRFFTRRNLADEIGRKTAALVLANSIRNFEPDEQESILSNESLEWHKSIRHREPEEGKEDVWKDRMVLDERIAERMRTFALTQDDAARAESLAKQPVAED